MHADRRGQGPVRFLFIHGFGGSGAVWEGQVSYFESLGCVLTVDLPGHGVTPWLGENIDAMALDLGRLLDDEGSKDSVAVIASSLGGLAVLRLWEQRPAVFRSLTFTGSVPRFTATDGFPAGLSVIQIDKMAAQVEQDPGRTLDIFFRSLFTRPERESAQYAFIRELRRQMPVPSKEVLQAFLNILKTTDARELLRSVHVPVQFILGENDPICPAGIIPALKEILPEARFDVMPDCGHLPFLSRPCEFNGLLRDFLK